MTKEDILYLFDVVQTNIIAIQSQFFSCSNALEIVKEAPEKIAIAKEILDAFGIVRQDTPNPLPKKVLLSLNSKLQSLLNELQKLVQLAVQFFAGAKNKLPILKKLQSIDLTSSWLPGVTFSFEV